MMIYQSHLTTSEIRPTKGYRSRTRLMIYYILAKLESALIWTMLYYAGYLAHDGDLYFTEVTPYDRVTYDHYMQSGDAMKLNVCIPNQEVFLLWIDWLQISSSPALNAVLDALLDDGLISLLIQSFQSCLSTILVDQIPASCNRVENFYHGYMLGWLACAKFEGYSVNTGCRIRSHQAFLVRRGQYWHRGTVRNTDARLIWLSLVKGPTLGSLIIGTHAHYQIRETHGLSNHIATQSDTTSVPKSQLHWLIPNNSILNQSKGSNQSINGI